MKKMNKKGFTLIEMLVVIAIIAVMVSIIIPTVMNSTNKANAAATAANLRSLKAEITTSILTGDGAWADVDLKTAGDVTPLSEAQEKAVAKALGDASKFTLTVNDDQSFTVTYESKTIEGWAKDAGNAPQVTETTPATTAGNAPQVP